MQAKEVNQIKVFRLKTLLKEVINNPADFEKDKVLVASLQSQGGIAKYENTDKDIAACSLNTLKRTSDDLLERGFLSLDELRLNAKVAIEEVKPAAKANKKTKTGLNHTIAELEAQLDIVHRSNFLLTTIIKELCSKLKGLSEHDGSVEERKELYRIHHKLIEAELTYTLNGEL